MPFERSQRTRFDDVAATYAGVRPGYPEALIDDAVRLGGVPPRGRILEIGCGPGNATIPLAKRGYEIAGIELGEELAALARAACRAYPHVRIDCGAFEDWPLPREPFDLVFSASAFHWIDPAVGYPKAAAALTPSGAIALCWNRHPPEESPMRRALDDIYHSIVPELARKAETEPFSATLRRPIDEIASSGCFGEVITRSYEWSREYTAEQYVRLLHTYSDHLALPGDTLGVLCHAIREEIERGGGVLRRPYLSVLYLAHVERRQRCSTPSA